MDVSFILLKILFSAFLFATPSSGNSCTQAKCSVLSPEIRFPFRNRDVHPDRCGVPGFELFCRDNRTMIHFPSYGDLAVKSISYDVGRLSLIDPKNCVHEVFLNLNLSHTPFSYYYVVEEYNYISCSAQLLGSFKQVPCLSSTNNHVYVLESSSSVPVSCTILKTTAIPFSYSPYLSDNGFGLCFTWNQIPLNMEGSTSLMARLYEALYAVSITMALFVLLAMAVSAKFSQDDEESEENNGREFCSCEKLLVEAGDYEAIKTSPLDFTSDQSNASSSCVGEGWGTELKPGELRGAKK